METIARNVVPDETSLHIYARVGLLRCGVCVRGGGVLGALISRGTNRLRRMVIERIIDNLQKNEYAGISISSALY